MFDHIPDQQHSGSKFGPWMVVKKNYRRPSNRGENNTPSRTKDGNNAEKVGDGSKSGSRFAVLEEDNEVEEEFVPETIQQHVSQPVSQMKGSKEV